MSASLDPTDVGEHATDDGQKVPAVEFHAGPDAVRGCLAPLGPEVPENLDRELERGRVLVRQ